ncbi:hypothetical protein KFK09_024047 [Dendrobium nobile]|uniref:Retrotransposon gag domain-containing protein n=1 Tax=Dendrobium nobile TaxID=94219 RepID=A0A8T3ACP0_DENNO|nr:hypothetical protein KFK09_024047 [Dendrobium nobile]
MVEQQVKDALAKAHSTSSISKGRPYPEEFDSVPYPKGFVPPSFKNFDGTGNPKQHLAHFRASSYNAGGSDALLFRQFVSSLSGIAFDWYAKLPNGSIHTLNDLEAMFVKRFAGAKHHITVGDLVVETQKPEENLVDYILRWRNLSMRCEPQLQEQHAIEILLKNIHGPVAFLLKGFKIKTFEKLLNKASNLQEEASQLPFAKDLASLEIKKLKPQKVLEKKSGTVSAVDKGMQPMQIQEPPRIQNPIQVDSIARKQEKNKAPIIEPKEVQADQAPLVPEKEQKKKAELYSDKLVVSKNGEHVSLKPLILYDFYFVPPGTKKTMKKDSTYIMFVSGDEYSDHNLNNNENNSQDININETDEQFQYYYDSDSPILDVEGDPINIELELSDSDTPPEEVQAAINDQQIKTTENASSEEEKQVTDNPETSNHPQPVQGPELQNTKVSKVDYNVLAHLRKLPAKLSIYDALVLSKEMREALVKALLDPKICMAQSALTQSDEEALYFKEVPGVTFSDEDLQLGTADHNHPLYISITIDNFKVSRLLIDLVHQSTSWHSKLSHI